MGHRRRFELVTTAKTPSQWCKDRWIHYRALHMARDVREQLARALDERKQNSAGSSLRQRFLILVNDLSEFILWVS